MSNIFTLQIISFLTFYFRRHFTDLRSIAAKSWWFHFHALLFGWSWSQGPFNKVVLKLECFMGILCWVLWSKTFVQASFRRCLLIKCSCSREIIRCIKPGLFLLVSHDVLRGWNSSVGLSGLSVGSEALQCRHVSDASEGNIFTAEWLKSPSMS